MAVTNPSREQSRAQHRQPVAAPPSVRRSLLPQGLMLPTVLALVVALGYPLVRQVVLSFQEFGLAQQFGRPAEWVGLQNYRELITDPYLWTVVARGRSPSAWPTPSSPCSSASRWRC